MNATAALNLLDMNPADRAAAIAALRANFAKKCAEVEPVRPAHVAPAYWMRMSHAEKVAVSGAL
jgi:hypothetical protein